MHNQHLYPGIHLVPNERSVRGMQSIEPKSQMLIIWKALCKYIEVKLKSG